MNRELLARVRDRIAEVGNEHCNMLDYTYGAMLGSGEPHCGTTACIAGHTLAVRYGSFNEETTKIDDAAARARRLLDLPSEAVFFHYDWPKRYLTLLRDEGHAKGMLAVCDALLDGVLTFDALGALVEAEVGGRDE